MKSSREAAREWKTKYSGTPACARCVLVLFEPEAPDIVAQALVEDLTELYDRLLARGGR